MRQRSVDAFQIPRNCLAKLLETINVANMTCLLDHLQLHLTGFPRRIEAFLDLTSKNIHFLWQVGVKLTNDQQNAIDRATNLWSQWLQVEAT